MKVGDVVDDFEAIDQHGARRRLSELLAGGPLVLYFYPKAFTPGCTRESCHFRDMGAELAAAGGHAVGVSADAVEKQAAFDTKYELGFPLLSDSDRRLARLFGVKRPGPLFNKRATFVIDTDRRVLAAIQSEMNMNLHADQAIAVLRERAAAQPQADLAGEPQRRVPAAGGPAESEVAAAATVVEQSEQG
jgi:thioredoxin-dependent peroxiredoxin